MTYKVECENELLSEVHVIVEDVERLPIVIYDKLITELHNVNDGLFEADKAFKVTPSEAQASDWIWTTENGKMEIQGAVDPMNVPCSIDFWLK